MIFTLRCKKNEIETVDQYTYIDQLYARARKLILKDLKKQGVKKQLREPKAGVMLWHFRCYDFLRLSDRCLFLDQVSDR